jgi:hypothetical protein
MARRPIRLLLPLLIAAALASACAGAGSGRSAAPPPPPPETPHDAVVRIANGIRRAGYEDDRPRLMTLFAEMEPYTAGELASRARYWRGFALWRGAWNGIVDGAPWEQIEADWTGAADEFRQALTLEPEFVDARIGQLACRVGLAPTILASERPKEHRRIWDLFVETQKAAPENPRLAWVFGTVKWETPVKLGGGQDKAIQMYKDGLGWSRKQTVTDAADPLWGEAELLMSLASANLNARTPNLDAAGHYAQAALNICPNWRWIQDVLSPKIEEAKKLKEQKAQKPGAH